MIIDFHTHVFPDKIAEKSINALEKRAGIKAYTNGTLCDLKEKMVVDLSVILPVVTKPSQFDTVNQFAAELNDKESKIFSFGGIHPESDNYKEELRRIRDLGLKGIKLHPDYQGIFFDDIKMLRLVDYASELGLIISVHAGVDIGLPTPVHCSPQAARHVIDQIHPPKLVLAHLGGWKQWELVEDLLVGQDVYFDTAFTNGYLENEQFLRIIKNHGADKILFATDSPWSGQKESMAQIRSLGLSEEQENKILGDNAEKLLG